MSHRHLPPPQESPTILAQQRRKDRETLRSAMQSPTAQFTTSEAQSPLTPLAATPSKPEGPTPSTPTREHPTLSGDTGPWTPELEDDIFDAALLSAVAYASADHREAPWYGVWVIFLKNNIEFIKKDGWKYIMALTFPQYPVTQNFDTFDGIQEDEPSASSPNTPTMDATVPNSSPLSPIPSSPSVLEHTEDQREQPASGSKVLGRRRSLRLANFSHLDDVPSDDKDGDPHGTDSERTKGRSTRIPDFLMKLMILRRISNNQTPSVVRTRSILIVECKPTRARRHTGRHNISTAYMNQIMGQASHAFQEDPSLQIIGCVLTVGSLWTYWEINRHEVTSLVDSRNSPDMLWEPSPANSLDSNTPLTPFPAKRRNKSPLYKNFRVLPLIDILDSQTKTRLAEIKTRLREISQDLWDTFDGLQSEINSGAEEEINPEEEDDLYGEEEGEHIDNNNDSSSEDNSEGDNESGEDEDEDSSSSSSEDASDSDDEYEDDAMKTSD